MQALDFNLLSVHSVQREGRVLMVTDIYWAQVLVETVDLTELYAEYVHIDVAVLQVSRRS